jgi:hypothetical protein
MSMGYVDKLTGTNITCMEEICIFTKSAFYSTLVVESYKNSN